MDVDFSDGEEERNVDGGAPKFPFESQMRRFRGGMLVQKIVAEVSAAPPAGGGSSPKVYRVLYPGGRREWVSETQLENRNHIVNKWKKKQQSDINIVHFDKMRMTRPTMARRRQGLFAYYLDDQKVFIPCTIQTLKKETKRSIKCVKPKWLWKLSVHGKDAISEIKQFAEFEKDRWFEPMNFFEVSKETAKSFGIRKDNPFVMSLPKNALDFIVVEETDESDVDSESDFRSQSSSDSSEDMSDYREPTPEPKQKRKPTLKGCAAEPVVNDRIGVDGTILGKNELEPMNAKGEFVHKITELLTVYQPHDVMTLKTNKCSRNALDWEELLHDMESSLRNTENVFYDKNIFEDEVASEDDSKHSEDGSMDAEEPQKPENSDWKKEEMRIETGKPEFKKGAMAAQLKRTGGLEKSLDCRTKFTAMEFCAGGGGLATGLKHAGWRTMCLLDFVAECTQSLSGNFPTKPVMLGDLKDCQPKKEAFETLDLLCAGLPCQSFSLLGKRDKFAHEDKGRSLWESFIHIAKTLQPKLVVVENVAPCMKDMKTECPEICQWFYEAGYTLSAKVLNSNNLGVPQARSRMILIATNKKLPLAGKFTYKKYLQYDPRRPKFKTVFEGNPVADALPVGRKYIEDVIPLIPAGGNFESIDENVRVKLEKYLGVQLRAKDLRRPDPNKPCPTITTGGGAMSGWGCILHPKEPRALNLIEMGRVQTFPDDHFYGGGLEKQVMQIGNAVPCKMGERLGECFKEYLLDNAKLKPQLFPDIPEAEHEWMAEHMGLENTVGKRGTSCPSGQYSGAAWHPQADRDKLDFQRPNLNFLYPGDKLIVQIDDGNDIVEAEGVALYDFANNLVAHYTCPLTNIDVEHKIQRKYKDMARGAKGIVGVGLAPLDEDSPTQLELIDFEADHERGTVLVLVKREICGRVFKYKIPLDRAMEGPENLVSQIKERKKKVKFPRKNPFHESRADENKNLFCPTVTSVLGHHFKVGTRVEVFRTKKNGAFDNHPVEGVVCGAGRDQIWKGYPGKPKVYRDISFPKDHKKAVAKTFHHLFRKGNDGKKNVLRLYVQQNGRMWISEGIYMKCLPVQEKEDKALSTWNITQRTKDMLKCKLMVEFGKVNGKHLRTYMTRDAMSYHVINQVMSYGEVRCLNDDVKREVCKKKAVCTLQEKKTYMFLTRDMRLRPAYVKQLARQYAEVMWDDGICEVIDRTCCCVRALLKEEKHLEMSASDLRKIKYQCPLKWIPVEKKAFVDPRGNKRDREKLVFSRGDAQVSSALATRLKSMNVVPARRASRCAFSKEFIVSAGQHILHNVPKKTLEVIMEKNKDLDLQKLTYPELRSHEDLGPLVGLKQGKGRKRKDDKHKWLPYKETGPLWKISGYPNVLGNHGNWYVGQKFASRHHGYLAGVQRQTMRGICTFKDSDMLWDDEVLVISDAVVFGNGYADDTHDLELDVGFKPREDYWYTGEGREGSGDQTWESPGNKGLKNAYELGLPVRLLIKKFNNPRKKTAGDHYVYAGLYTITEIATSRSEGSCQMVARIRFGKPYEFDHKGLEKHHKKCLKWNAKRLQKLVSDMRNLNEIRIVGKLILEFTQGQIYRRYPKTVNPLLLDVIKKWSQINADVHKKLAEAEGPFAEDSGDDSNKMDVDK